MLRLTSVLAALAVTLPAAAFAAGPKLGVVDVAKAMEAIPTWTKAVGDLKSDFEKKKAELEKRQAELQKKRDQLDAKRMVSDPKALAAEEEKFLASANDFRLEFTKAQQEISKREMELKEVMLRRIEIAVNQVATDGEYDYIFELGAENAKNVLYASKGIDVTDKVIAAYKKGFGEQPLFTSNTATKKDAAAKKAP